MVFPFQSVIFLTQTWKPLGKLPQLVILFLQFFNLLLHPSHIQIVIIPSKDTINHLFIQIAVKTFLKLLKTSP